MIIMIWVFTENIYIQECLLVYCRKRGLIFFFCTSRSLHAHSRKSTTTAIFSPLLGCFKDNASRVLERDIHNLNPNGKEYCKTHCSELGFYKYFGVEVFINITTFYERTTEL